MKNIMKGFIFALAIIATSAQAIPTLEFFGGDDISDGVSYTASSGLLEVDAYLIASTDINPSPVLAGSSLSFSALFDNQTNTNGIVAGFFSSSDLVVTGGDDTQLLTGVFTELAVAGAEGWDFGFVQGSFMATGGSLINEFGLGTLFALELNLSSTFSDSIFASDFTAQIDGDITGVPEPGMLALLCIGLLFFGFSFRTKTKTSFNA